jgi:hypothetical protein
MGAKDDPDSGPEEFRKPDIQFYSIACGWRVMGLGAYKKSKAYDDKHGDCRQQSLRDIRRLRTDTQTTFRQKQRAA